MTLYDGEMQTNVTLKKHVEKSQYVEGERAASACIQNTAQRHMF